MRTLFLLRHAKSDWDDPDLDDHDRPLAPRGERAAVLMGVYLRQMSIAPDFVLCSTAHRAVETWDRLSPHLPRSPAFELDPGLYLCGWRRMLERIRQVPDERQRVMIVAHNPDLEQLAHALIPKSKSESGDGHRSERPQLPEKYPTAALAIIGFDTDHWSEVTERSGRLARYAAPKMLV